MSTKQIVHLFSNEFQPKNNFILVKPAEHKKEAVTQTGIIIPINQSSLDRPTSGTVVSVGSDIKDISENTFVLWPNTDGLDIEFIDGIFILLQYKSIIGFKKNK
jgi:co-chaperonin GroES (HSP10)